MKGVELSESEISDLLIALLIRIDLIDRIEDKDLLKPVKDRLFDLLTKLGRLERKEEK